ncbi:serine endopeptidase [Solimicrobium silvestre]|uniref:Double zinc ribbon n=1 Tax=Solimicrobium silvestre TaxID=2099400 RepID=A0A2S9H4U6_9BURK|nr:serine endopeptidase [Solimicrobium silvestre]PRC95010.1 hypothetical protein S2091_0205 [Solimicrobium silvestre]
MSKSLRLSEKWFRFGLWIVAVVFAGFLIGLGSNVVQNLPQVEHHYSMSDFIDKNAAAQADLAIKTSRDQRKINDDNLDQAERQYESAKADSQTARDSFTSWIATRRATALASQDSDLIARNQQLDKLKNTERSTLAQVQQLQEKNRSIMQEQQNAETQLSQLQKTADVALEAEQRKQDLRVFLYRLALTLPLLVVAGWLLKKKRKSTYWPFVWGFVFFSVFTFFVELVPYLPSYGGYVRYGVGIIITVLVGRQAIISLNAYLERQKLAEQLPNQQRREELSYDVALTRLAKQVCPGCEREVDLKNPANDFCQHCGICLFDHCRSCNTRKNAFTKFCHSCGANAANKGLETTVI